MKHRLTAALVLVMALLVSTPAAAQEELTFDEYGEVWLSFGLDLSDAYNALGQGLDAETLQEAKEVTERGQEALAGVTPMECYERFYEAQRTYVWLLNLGVDLVLDYRVDDAAVALEAADALLGLTVTLGIDAKEACGT